ncbi:MAG: serine phosphatase RsbU (regulator of sigma subunit) [Planctomycetota bacterium]|jgi:serine phosphatase RsbU (regulator of sigma subunit)
MSRNKSQDLRIKGLGIAAQFALAMGGALAIVMAVAGFIQLNSAKRISAQAVDRILMDATAAASDAATAKSKGHRPIYTKGETFQQINGAQLNRYDIEFNAGRFKGQKGALYTDGNGELIIPMSAREEGEDSLAGLYFVLTALVILVGGGVALTVGNKITGPLNGLVDDVRNIARGNLSHRTRVKGGGEVALLARSIDRMALSLADAREAELELNVRESEVEVAHEVREALLPEDTPALPGFEFADRYIGSLEPGGDFHDYIFSKGKVTLIVCEVAGRGIPGALIGATARAYLRGELEREVELGEALRKVNRDLARDVRRGMYVTVMCVQFNPKENVALVACAGHRQPLVRYEAEAGAVRTLQPEGIALGFDKGPVFDRSLEILKVPVEPGDRLILANTGPVRVANADGEELGETEFYREIARGAKTSADTMLEYLEGVFEDFAGDEPFPADISILILARDEEDIA